MPVLYNTLPIWLLKYPDTLYPSKLSNNNTSNRKTLLSTIMQLFPIKITHCYKREESTFQHSLYPFLGNVYPFDK